MKVTYIVIPCKPDVYNIEATEKMARDFLDKSVNFRVLISDAMPQGNYMRANDMKNHFGEQGIPCFDQIIPRSAKIIDAGDQGKTVSDIIVSVSNGASREPKKLKSSTIIKDVIRY